MVVTSISFVIQTSVPTSRNLEMILLWIYSKVSRQVFWGQSAIFFPLFSGTALVLPIVNAFDIARAFRFFISCSNNHTLVLFVMYYLPLEPDNPTLPQEIVIANAVSILERSKVAETSMDPSMPRCPGGYSVYKEKNVSFSLLICIFPNIYENRVACLITFSLILWHLPFPFFLFMNVERLD